jgi:phosphoglycolate phosphatase
MAASHKRLAVFDCDGTLVDAQADICAAIDEAFAAMGIPAPPHQATRRVVGLSLPEAIARLHPGGSASVREALGERYRTAYNERRMEGRSLEPLYDGIAPVLDTLLAADWLLGVATGKSERGLARCLADHGLADRFVTLHTADRHPSKPHPAMLEAAMAATGIPPTRCTMIGDTDYDMTMAKAAGARAIGVAWGYHEASELFASGAEAVARNPAELPVLLDAET